MVDKYNYFIGIDPSFVGLGLSIIDEEKKEITFKELSVDVVHGAFAEIADASHSMTTNVIIELKDIWHKDKLVGMEIPPVTGMYAVKLWALDTEIYRALHSNLNNDIYLFNVTYLKFINKEYKSKKDTKNMINSIVDVFKDNGWTINQTLLNKKDKPRTLTSNECDSFLYAIRMYIKYHYDNGLMTDMLSEIVNINDKFLEEKETKIGKKIDNK